MPQTAWNPHLEERVIVGERFRYLYDELIYARSVLETFSHRYYVNLRSTISLLVCLLQDSVQPEAKLKPREINRFFRLVPEIHLQIIVSLLQFRPGRIRYFAFGRNPVVTLSDVHPDYPLSIRAIETISSEFHEAVSSLTTRVVSPTLLYPIICTLPGSNFHLKKPEYIPNMLGFEEKDDAKRTGDVARRVYAYADLCYVILPRWLVAHIRYGSILAHEQFHRVELLMDMYDNYVVTRCPGPSGNLTQDVRRDCESIFGSTIMRLSDKREEIESSYFSFLCAEIGVKHRHGSSSRVQHLRRLSIEHVSELLADAFEVMVAGPAAAYALLPVLSIQPFEIEPLDRIPVCLRSMGSIEALRVIGFHRVAGTLQGVFEHHLSRLGVGRRLMDEVDEWLHKKHGMELIAEFMGTLSHGFLSKNAIFASRYRNREHDYEDKIRFIIESAASRNLFRITDCSTASEILNAIWEKMARKRLFKCKGMRRIDLRWRKILACLGGWYE